ncbi:MAG: hypothetical protein CL677_05690 [Bdellovibrionaceae bacterium]|nr:hypothetical protein [Pseudobdellovibrionaceae bacterium]|tara:strand:+ start:330 stop:641 length:312 start_codon:yes stop_codon:yes gene_type:complete
MGHSRRDFLKKAMVTVPAVGIAAITYRAHAADPDANKLVTDVPANKGLLMGLQYVNESKKAGQSCKNCNLYTAGKDGKGKCSILPKGLVAEKGWCVTWQAKQG